MKTMCSRDIPDFFIKFVILLTVALLNLHCAGNQSGESPPDDHATQKQAETQIANPASVNCVDKGGKLEMMEEAGGQFGVCVFQDGSRCEEWRFFRNECKPGTCTERSGICNK